MKRWFGGLFLAIVAAFGASACDDPAPDLAEWTVADHDQEVEVKTSRRPAPLPPNYAQPSARNQLVEVTWLKQCASCHGKHGRGDGPSSPMVKARDLSKAEWQASVTDEQLAQVIRQGKDKMPAFNFPDSMVQSLVLHVRDLVAKPPQNGNEGAPSEATGAAGTTAPAAAVTPAPGGAVAPARPGAVAPPPQGRPTPGR
jgi:mono/diheme cytochrome c family protein